MLARNRFAQRFAARKAQRPFGAGPRVWTAVALIAGCLAGAVGWNTPVKAAEAPGKYTVSLTKAGGTVDVYWMGTDFPLARAHWLINTADSSMCNTTNPVNNPCKGLMNATDVIVMGDGYMAWLDKTRSSEPGMIASGGGGLLRGLWRLTGSGDTKNFAYLGNNNWAPSLMMPCQSAGTGRACDPGASGKYNSGDGMEILVSPTLNEADPNASFRGSDAVSYTIVAADTRFENNAWKIRAKGTLAHPDNTNKSLATDANPDVAGDQVFYYNVFYTFHNTTFAPNDARTRNAIEIRTTIDACGNCGGRPKDMATAVVSFSLSGSPGRGPSPDKPPYAALPDGMAEQVVMDTFQPLSHPMWYEGSAPGNQCPSDNPNQYPVGQVQPAPGGVLTSRTPGPFSMRIKSRPGSDTSGHHLQISGATISGTNGLDVSTRSFQQYGIDQHEVYIFDQKVDGAAGCPQRLQFEAGQSLVFNVTLGLWYGDAIWPTEITTTTTTTAPPTTTTTAPPPPPKCSNGVDDDGDTKADFPSDLGCDGPADNDEWHVARDRLLPGEQLMMYEWLVDPYSRYCMVMQADGNVVVYTYDAPSRTCYHAHIWDSGTGGRGPNHRLIMQTDGNLVIQHGADFPIWYRPGDARVAGSYLRLQCDKNVVLYTPSGGVAWQSGTSDGTTC